MELRAESGIVLAAAPELLDPNFVRSVVLICKHVDEGAYGLVVNKRSAYTVDQLLPDHPVLGGLRFPVHFGGPVSRDKMQILHRVPELARPGTELVKGLWLGADLDAAADYLAGQGLDGMGDVRFLVGYSGWAEDQLDQELAGGSWLPAATQLDWLFGGSEHHTWRQVVRRVEREVGGCDETPFDPPPDVSWN
ncbi:MAG: YqgE/AlgH family protein [Planctomycetes bacterium]|nr:YqgE/AlgH family protein [Planctomycetota bacterium]MCB9904768.1 YqgE/AlgH family protein [Planctomycetota bacterium]